MKKLLVKGGNELHGEINISAAKNSVLPIIVSTILCPELISLKNIPMLEDVKVLCNLLDDLNSSVNYSSEKNLLYISTDKINPIESDNNLVKKMRASFLLMGPMLSRFGYCKLSLPGGCNIGSRPIDLHLKGFKILGADIQIGHGYVEASAPKGLIGNSIYLDFPSVGATENIIMASVLAKGTTIIENAAEEPEISDLINFLNSMGAKITGGGTGKIIIEGVNSLHGISYTPIFDRIEAGTFIIAAAITNSIITLNGVNPEHLQAVIEKLKETGVNFTFLDNKIIVDGRQKNKGVDIKTMPYPGFPTDMQSPIMSLLCTSLGNSIITETVFENRFMHVNELVRMGACIKLSGRSAFIQGVPRLTGCEVRATDLRAGAAMILAGLHAKGKTIINNIHHIDRGYLNIENKFNSLGANIERI